MAFLALAACGVMLLVSLASAQSEPVAPTVTPVASPPSTTPAAGPPPAQPVPGATPTPVVPTPVVPPPTGARPPAAPAKDAESEGDSDLPDFADLRTPDSPAFVLLGVSPTEIQRPTSTRQLAVTLSDAFAADGAVGIPDAFALELSPFWLVPHDDLSLEEFVNARFFETLGQNATFSLATTTEEVAGATPEEVASRTLLGFGGRTRVIERRNQPCMAQLEALRNRNQTYSAELRSVVNDPANASLSDAEFTNKIEAKKAEIDAKQAGVAEDFNKAAETCEADVGAHDGFVLDVAFAGAFTFLQAAFKRGKLSKLGAWMTLGYAGDYVSLLAMGKYQQDAMELDNQRSTADAGLRFIGYFDRFAFSTELVLRLIIDEAQDRGKSAQWRVTGGVDYHIGDGVWLNTTFGRDYEDDEDGSLIALLNLRADFGDRSIEKPTLEPPRSE